MELRLPLVNRYASTLSAALQPLNLSHPGAAHSITQQPPEQSDRMCTVSTPHTGHSQPARMIKISDPEKPFRFSRFLKS